MSVLIKGMEMPTSCCQCPVNLEVCKKGYEYLLAHPELYDQRADDCPIVSVPEHGRLIDADALVLPTNLNDWNSIADYIKNITDVWKAIDAAPTIIPASEESG